MKIFNGIKLASQREALLKQRVERDFSGRELKIAAVLFIEDSGSRLYTKLKREAASRVGIQYDTHQFSLSDSVEDIISKINELNDRKDITGIIIQKPWRGTWVKAQSLEYIENISKQDNPRRYEREQYAIWWSRLTSEISETKDVDGLHPKTIEQIKDGNWLENGKVLPATCRAVLTILDRAGEVENFSEGKYIVIGKSDLLGKPLYYELLRQKKDVELIASRKLKERMSSGQKLLDASVVVSATGSKKLITGDMVSDNVVVIDVGEPSADVDFDSVKDKASFITPVPGGVGPMTVVSLLENCLDLVVIYPELQKDIQESRKEYKEGKTTDLDELILELDNLE